MALKIDWDRERWLFIPNEFPWHVYETEDAWVEMIAGVFQRAGWQAEQVTWLRDYLRGLRANNTAEAWRFAWLVDPGELQVSIDVFERPHAPDISLHDMTGSDGSDEDVRPPIIEQVVAAGLGPGYRVDRAFRVPHSTHEVIGAVREEILGMVFWVFRGGGSDVVVTLVGSQPTVMAAVLPDIAKFIDTIEVAAA